MIVLAIETSCDDTGIAIVKKRENGDIKKLSSVLSSQDKIHAKWGGVYPFEAKREHQKNLIPSLYKALKDASFLNKGETSIPLDVIKILKRDPFLLEEVRKFFKKNRIKKIDAIAVTIGPGLEPCLHTGVNFAKALSLILKVPIIPVNHIKAHIFSFLYEKREINFPAIALVVSGGHTELILIKSFSSYKLIGKTRDDAAGECFDKTARILGFSYPGGPQISVAANKFTSTNPFKISLPRPMIYSNNYDFSFSGLKTAVLYNYHAQKEKDKKDERYIIAVAKEIEEAITDVLVFKLKKAIKEFNIKTVILGGGVTANKRLREKTRALQKSFSHIDIIIPSISLSTDNAEMIAAVSFMEKEKSIDKIVVSPNLKIYNNCDKIKKR